MDELIERIEKAEAARKGFIRGKIRAGHDYPCALHKGPKGDCNPWNCRCY